MKSLLPYMFMVLISSVCGFPSFTQNSVIDSLETQLKKMNDDTSKVILLNDMISKYQYTNPERAMALSMQSIELAKHINFDFGLGVAYRLTGTLYVNKSNFDSSMDYYDKSLKLFVNKNDYRSRKYIGLLQHGFGVVYQYKGKYDSAVNYYLEATRIYKDLKEDNLQFLTYNNLSTLYSQIGDNKKALQYAQECVAISNRLQDPYKISISSLAMASAKSELKDYQGIDTFINKVITISQKSGNYYMLGMGYKFLGKYQLEANDDTKAAISSYKLVLDNMTKAQNDYEIAAANQNLGFSYYNNGDDDQAVHYFKIAIDQSKKLQLPQIEQYALKNLSALEKKRKNFSAAFGYLENYVSVKDSVISKTNEENIQALEAKYQSEIKDSRISQLDGEKKLQTLSIKQKSILNYFLAGSVASLLIVGFLGYRNLRHRQQLAKQQDALHQQRIRELEKDRQLVAVDSMLKGQEEERSRLAKDLHDGLGGLLSGVKFSLSNMKDNLIITPENMVVFERSVDMIDTSIKELRRVAHNMMPEMLTKFGLDEALKEYCRTMNDTNLFFVTYQSMGMESRIEKSTEIIIYRIIQELLNNIMKHAAATNVHVQLIKEQDRFSIIVEDNGKGFDTAIVKDTKGAGLTSIQSRVDYLKGQMEIHSDADKGTLINIEFKIES